MANESKKGERKVQRTIQLPKDISDWVRAESITTGIPQQQIIEQALIDRMALTMAPVLRNTFRLIDNTGATYDVIPCRQSEQA